ncbi:MAG: NDP-sugar synthase [Acidobacteria bacterium]|nr:NDP-sugar synthase [Acidobacteriota bacterium]
MPPVRPSGRAVPAGVILAGSFPWDNAAFDRLLPRALVPVASRPLITYGMAWMASCGLTSVTVCGNRNTRLLAPELDRHTPAGLTLTYMSDPMPRGSAGCLADAVANEPRDTVVVIDSTALPNVDLSALLTQHWASRAAATLVVHAQPPTTTGVSWPTPVGIYVFDREALTSIPPRGYFDIKEHLIPRLCNEGRHVGAFVAAAETPRVLNAPTYLAVNALVTEQVIALGHVPEGYRRHGEALVHLEATVAADAVLAGPIIVAAGTTIGSGAVVVGPASLGCDVAIEADAVVSRSAVWRRSRVGRGAAIDRTIVGDDAIVAPRVVVSHAVVAPAPGGAITERYAFTAVPSRFTDQQVARTAS